MQDFLPCHVTYQNESSSDYQTWRFYLSTRDMARLGTLVANEWRWQDKQIISSECIDLMTTSHTEIGGADDYGYLCWIDKERNIFMAVGYRGQYIVVDQKNNISMAVKINSGVNIYGELKAMIRNVDIETEGVYELLDLITQEMK